MQLYLEFAEALVNGRMLFSRTPRLAELLIDESRLFQSRLQKMEKSAFTL